MKEGKSGAVRLPILKSLRDLAKSGAKLDASIVTTYAFNGLFYEEVLLRALERAGSRLNIVLVDAAQLAETLRDPLRRPTRAGADYLLAPIRHSGAFHPKMIAMLSEKQPFLVLGSHNATDVGFSHNEEVTAYWGAGDTPPAGVLRSAVEYALHWLQTADAAPSSVISGVVERLRSLLPNALGAENRELSLIVSSADACLWDQLQANLEGTVQRVWVVGPYFDSDMSFLKAIDASLVPSEILIGIQPDTAILPRPELAPKSARFLDMSAIAAFWPKPSEVGFAHGKALAIETTEGLIVSLGSANPTSAAWLLRTPWNAEANLCLTGASASAAFSALGFNLLKSCPSVDASTLASIANRSQSLRRQEQITGPPSGPPLLCGVIEERGVFLPDFDRREFDAAALFRSPGMELPVNLEPVEGGSLIRHSGEVPSGGLYELQSHRLTVAFILLNDREVLRKASMPRESARILDRLGALDTNAGFAELLDLLDKHVLGTVEASGVGASRSPSVGPEGSEEAGEEVPFGPRGVSLPVDVAIASRRPRLNDGLIADIISALIRALGAPPLPPIDGDAPDLDEGDALDEPSSEQLARNIETDVGRAEIDWPRLVTACRKRLSVMIRKLEARMAEASAGEHSPGWALGRLVVVLSLLQRLRSHPPQSRDAISGRIRPSSLVSLDQLRSAFGIAVCAMYGKGRLAAQLERAASTRGAEERQLLDNMLMWYAREIGADYQRRPGEKEDAATLQARADLSLVVMSAAAYPRLEDWAEYRDPSLSLWDDALTVSPDWTSRQMEYGGFLQATRGTRLAVGVPPLKSGDLVQWRGEQDVPWVLGSISGLKVTLIEPGGIRGAEKKVLLSYVSMFNMNATPHRHESM